MFFRPVWRRRPARAGAPLLAAGVLAVLTVAALPEAEAIPRFAVRNGAHCTLCHVNPNGGGARNDYGRDVFEKTRLYFTFLENQDSRPTGDWKDDDPGAPSRSEGKWRGFGLSGAVTEWLTFGADMRMSFLYVEKLVDPLTGVSTNDANLPGRGLFLMQGDAYLVAEVSRFATLYFDTSVRAAFEAWALWMHPGRGYIRFGYFTPTFGLRLEEHRAYVTEDLALGAMYREAGVEVGGYVGPFQLNLAVAAPFSALGGGARTGAEALGFYGTLTFAKAFKAISLFAGVSAAVRTKVGAATPFMASALGALACGQREMIVGAFAGASLGRFTYMVEVDYAENRPYVGLGPMGDECAETDPGDAPKHGLVVFHELSFALMQGFDLIGTWEFKDPDVDFTTGAETRFGAGFEFFFSSFSELKVMWRHRATKEESLGTNGEDEVVLFVHLFF